MPPVPAKKAFINTTTLAGTPSTALVAPQVPAPIAALPILESSSPAAPAEACAAKSEEASEKPLSKAQLAAAATRDRMAEILKK
jgi:hypothetical protein